MIIYKVTNKLTGKCYIGKTIYTLERRKKSHLNCMKYKNYVFYNALRKYGIDNFTWEEICYCNNEDYLNILEQINICKYNSMHPSGYNMTLGGDGQSGHKHSEETKLKISMNNKMKGIAPELHPMFGKKHTEESLRKMSIASKSRKATKHSEETKLKISISKLGNKNPMFGKRAPNSREVLCVETGVIYSTVKDAEKQTNIFNISAVCRGTRTKAGGFTWRFIDNNKAIPSQA